MPGRTFLILEDFFIDLRSLSSSYELTALIAATSAGDNGLSTSIIFCVFIFFSSSGDSSTGFASAEKSLPTEGSNCVFTYNICFLFSCISA